MKRFALWLAFGATLIAMYFAPAAEEQVVVVPTRAAANVARAAPVAGNSALGSMDLKIRPRIAEEDVGNVFASHTWTSPQKPIEALEKSQERAPPPEAPPLPFRYLGRLVDDGKTAYFLQFNGRNLVIHVGDSIDKTYTLDGINNGTLTFTYLPLDQKQNLVVGEVN